MTRPLPLLAVVAAPSSSSVSEPLLGIATTNKQLSSPLAATAVSKLFSAKDTPIEAALRSARVKIGSLNRARHSAGSRS